jgi:GNAT superfamily N-acetyltransferase
MTSWDAKVSRERCTPADGYPVFVPEAGFRAFVAPDAALAAWVAEDDAHIVGHVMLFPMTSLRAVGLVRSTLGLKPSQVGVVARLTVAPSMRRHGLGRRLLDVAATDARRRGLTPILDVVTRHQAAVALYENAGWIRLGAVNFDLPDGTTAEEFVYRAPTCEPVSS